MWTDVADLQAFYETPTGLVARRLIRRKLRAMWPDVRGLSVMGFGFATPCLRVFHKEAERLVAFMPGPQGVLHWPSGEPCAVAACDESHLPLPDRSIDRILLVHAVEHSEALRPLLRDLWRVLADGGRMLLVVPSRRGLWSRIERTPFGQGRPFSERQLRRLLEEAMFTPLRIENGLFLPPVRARWLLATAPAWDRIGARWLPFLAGAMFAEVEKTVQGAIPLGARSPVRILPARLPVGVAAGARWVSPVVDQPAPDGLVLRPISPISNGVVW